MKQENRTVSAYLDGDVYSALEKIAKEQERTVSWTINKLLREAVANKPKKAKK